MNALFESHQADAVLRVAAYSRLDFKFALIGSPSSEHEPIRTSIVEAFPSSATAKIGLLERLPSEIVWKVCAALDVRSCFRLRQTNRRARQLVSGTHEYRTVAQHALESLRAVLRTCLSPHVTISALYQALCTRGCQICGAEFGGFLFLLTITRCCFNCIESSSRLRLVMLADVAKRAGVSSFTLPRRLAVLRTLPGKTQRRPWDRRISVVSYEQATDALTMFGLSRDSAASFLSGLSKMRTERYMASTPLPLFHRATAQVEHGICCKGCRIALEDKLYGQVVVQGLDDESVDLWNRSDQLYSRQGYLNHFPTCPQSINLWRSSQGGTVAVDEPEFTRRRGYMETWSHGPSMYMTEPHDNPYRQWI
ncbi:uncharacterized protein G6M90_00g051530 [Metarhizium brunneum]|uniref:F-box domain-containing protein n=1 Tax=Metarhizium brunneum TaxID=500148 RepID=A0A7D5Z5Z0_9HYPO